MALTPMIMIMTNPEHKEFVLPDSIDEYIMGILGWNKDLPKAVSREKDISKAKKLSFLPVTLSRKEIEDYEWVCPGKGKAKQDEWLVDKMQKHLRLGDDRVVVLMDAYAKPTDGWIKRTKPPIKTFREDVYFTASSEQKENPQYLEYILRALDRWSVGVMSSLPQSYLPMPRELDEETVYMLARNSEHIIFSIYDETGYILCSFK